MTPTNKPRVTVTLRGANKHRLPMSQQNCSVVHGAGIPSQGVCTFSDGRTPSNYHELSHCVREAACPIIDQQHQMVVFRDPRPLVVSAYFYLATLKRAHGTVDDYVVKMLPTYTQWVAVRYDLFAGEISNGSSRRACLSYQVAGQLPTTCVLIFDAETVSLFCQSAGRVLGLSNRKRATKAHSA